MKKCFSFILFLFSIHFLAFAQESSKEREEAAEKREKEMIDVLRGAPLTINMDYEEEASEEEENVYERKKREKRNVFYGEKTKKGYIRSGFRGNQTEELFHFLKNDPEPDPFIRDFYWYDFKSKRIVNSRNYNSKYGAVLHGPYTKKKDGQVLVEGVYFYGVKHGRWMYYDRNDVLLNKEKYFKGWPRDSQITYYDEEREQIKEVIPIENGVKEGYYYHFYDNGQLAVSGEYRFGQKVGQWIEYHYEQRRRKRLVIYPNDPFEKNGQIYISKEWDERGRLLYDHEARELKLKKAGYLSFSQ